MQSSAILHHLKTQKHEISMIRILHIIMAMLFFAVTSSAQTPAEVPVRYVSKSKGNYTNDGRSWATAKNNLQDAIEDLRKYMDENNLTKGHVYVSAGRYTPTTATPGGDGTLYTSFILYDGISVYGGFNPDTPEDKPGDRVLTNGSTIGTAKGETWLLKHETILSGNHTSTTGNPLTWDSGKNEYTETFTGNSYHVVWFASAGFDESTNRAKALGETAVLDGFTIRDGQSSNRITPAANDGSHAYHNSYGGGVYMVAGSEVRNCFITQNASTLRGGGVYMDGGGLLEQCYVIRNQSAGVGVTDGYGGGVAMDDGGMVRYCVIENNVARGGGGLALLYSKVPEDDKLRYSTVVTGTVINNNTSTAEAGGVYMRNGGLLNHVTIARNKCVGVNVVYNNRRYARSGGLYVDGGALVVNSVIWGNEVAANNNVQYATYRESAATTKTTFAYVALSRGNYSDWGGTIKKTNGVYYLSEDNTNTAVASSYPEFVKPTSTAGVIASDGNDNMDYEYDKSDWTPRFFSYLRHKGIQIDSYPNNDNIYHGHISRDYGGDAFAPRCIIGALAPYPMQGANAVELPDLENSGKTVRTVFVNPLVEKSNSLDTSDETKVGSSWEIPFYNINDALSYINGLADAPSQESPIQIVVKEGTTTTAGNAYLSQLRASTITVPSHVHLYGGFPASLTGTDISRRDPKNHPTRITANITGGSYKDNGTHIIVIGHGTSNAVVDGFQLYFANTQPNEVLKELGVRSGAGIAVLNAPTYPSTGKPTPAMTGNIIRNCIVANCTAPQGAALYMGNYSGRTMELKVENCIFHNNAVLAADSAIVAVSGENTRLELNHCLVRGNVGYAVQAMNNAGITMTNTALHANIGFDSAPADANLKVADLTATADKADGRVRTFNVLNGGTLTGNNNMMDIGLTDFTDVADPILRYHSTYTNENPNFVNATSNIGVNMDGDVTVYGSDPDWMPTNTNPMVNAATDDGMKGYDLTGNTTRDYGGAADIGALENTYQPAFGRVVYVRQGGTGDGSSWAKAMGDVQDAVDAAYQTMMGDASYVQTTVTEESREYTDWSDNSKRKTKDVKITRSKTTKPLVQVWVAAGTYTRSSGYTMKNNVSVYGSFPATGNPGMNERHPLLTDGIAQQEGDNYEVSDYETILQTAASIPSDDGARVLTHKEDDCRTTEGDGSDVPRDHIIYDNVRWDGFTIRHGRIGVKGGRNGGAGVNLFENVTLSNCVVRDNKMAGYGTGRGGGVYCDGGTIENCYIYNNDMTDGYEMYGAGIYAIDGHIYNSVISQNDNSGTTFPYGCGAFLEFAKFYNNTIVNNTGGAAIHVWTASGASASLTVYNTIVIGGSSAPLKKQGWDTQVNFYNCYLQGTSYETSNNEANAYTAANGNILYLGKDYSADSYHPFALSLTEANAKNDYRLGNNVCVNAGREEMEGAVLPDFDMDYTDRVKDCIVDIGAYEYNGAKDIMPDTKTDGYAFYYVIPHGTGNASADSPENAACWRKLQKILDAAGRYVYAHKDDAGRRTVVIKLAGDSKKDRTIDGNTVNGYEGFTYRPRRSNTVTSPGEEENPRTYSLIVPHGVEVWGGYSEDFKTRDILEYRTSFSGIFRQDDVDVQAYNVVTFTNNTYDADGELLLEDALANIQERAVLDGIFIENGMADGERMSTGELAETRVGGAAIVTGYAHIRNCIVQNNTAADMGGGLYLKPGALVSGSIIQYNAVTGGDGGGVYVEEPEEATGNYARIYTSDVIYNTASRAGGGIYFYTNLRANSSLFWQNASGELANVAGETMPTDAGDRELGINDYPVSFCATETTREPGINNIAVNTDMNKGVRFDDESYNHDYIASDGTPVKVMHNDHEFYKLEKYSLIVRSGMEYSEYNNLLKNNKDLLKVDLAGVDRTGYDNEFIDIGARAYPGRVLPEIDENNLMTRIFVAKNEYEVSMDAVNVMRNQTDNTYYSQEGSSFAYPMRYLGDALEYVRSARKKKNEKGEYINKNIPFEIVLGGGTFYPRRNIKGEYINSRGCTFLVPEGVTLVGGVSVENDGKYYGNVPAVGGIAENTATTTFTDAESEMSVVIDHANIESIIKRRKLHDINHNNIAEPWEMEIQTILSGQVINSTSSYNVYHVMACIADESCVGGMPDPTYTYTIDGAGTGRMPKYRGVPIVIDGINLEDGMALKYVEGAVNSKYTYYKGGAICVEGNWTNDGFVNEGGLDARPVGYRNIPLEVRNCSFMNNSGGRGGAIFTDGALKVFACNFAQNYAQVGSDTFRDGDNDVTISYAGRGGAVNATYETIIVNSLFANNEAEVENGNTGDMSGVGGALLMGEHSKLHAVNCNFVRNKAYGYPAIYCYQPNKGFTAATKGDEEQLKADNLHKVINSIFWGNESVNEDMDKVINFKKYNADGTIDAGGTMSDSPEALWFCAYEEGKGNEPVYSSNDIDYRLQDYKGYILTPEESDNPDDRFIGNGTYIPYLWKGEYTKLADDNVSLIVGGTSNPDVVDGLNPVTNNIIINSDNDAIDGPNFISPSPKAGKSGFYVSADWMIGRINNLVDNGWTYLQQDLSGEDPKFVYEDEANQRNVVGAGIYHSASYDYGKLSEERTAIPIGDDLYMSYSDAEAKPFLRVSTDPNPTHNQTFIDIGVYEYQHVKLSPNTEGHTDILWVTEKERTGGNVSDGKTWATATSDLQRAIETLLASRNGHDKEIRMLAGRYQPVYTINGNLAFTVTTNLQTGITPPDEKTETERGMQGVKSLTIRGGYSNELEGRENIENNPVYIYASERMGGNLNRGHVFVIEDMRQRLSGKDDKRELQEYVVPVVFKGLNISNTKANDDLSGGGVAVYYKDTDAKKKTYAVKKTAQDYNTKVEYTYDDISGEAGTDGKELYKFVMSQCSFFNNGSPEEESMPSVTIGKGGGNALICNSLFHSNKGNALIADNTKVVNCTFALNDSPIVFTNTGDDVSELHNSILWRNALKGGVSSEANPDVTGLAANTEDNKVMTFNAMSYLNREYYNNVPLSANNTDVINGPNFFDPMEVPDGTSAADLTVTVSPRDFHVNPSSKILSKGDVDIYVKLVKDLTGEYPYTADSNIERVRQDKDLADITRFYGSGLERGAYECVVALNRVLYVDPKKAILGNGISWENAYGKGQIQTAIDAASVYYDVSDGGTEAERRAYVFVKGLENKHTDEALIMRNGVSLYGSIDPTYIKQVDGEVKEGETNVTYSNENIDAYLTLMKADREGMAMSEHTVVGSVKAGDNVDFCLFDGLEIGSGDGNEPAETTEPVVLLGQNSTVAFVNSVINNNKVTGDAKLIENHSGLLYNVLVRDNGKADVNLGADGYMLNCTLAGETGSWESLLSPDNSRSINNIVYRDGDKVKPFAPYFRPSDVAYHAGDVPDSDNRNLWYQLHEKARYIGTGSNNDDVTGKQLLSNAALREYVDFTVDRDLLGNPRVLGNKIDLGCYETWSTGSYESLSSAAMTPETLFANRKEGSYAGNHYPHEGSVVYLQDKGNLVCELAPDTKSPYFTEEKPLKSGYLLAMEGGSLYGQGNEIRLQYVAAERKVAGRYAMVAMPFDMKNDDNHITCTTYAEEDGKVISMAEEVAGDGYGKYWYDGRERSGWNYEYKADNSSCWKPVDETFAVDGVIAANDGFLLDRGDNTGEEVLRFTSFGNASSLYPYQEGAADKIVTLVQHDQSDVDAGGSPFRFTSEYNMGWNLKGVPYLISGYDTGVTGDDGRETMFVPHVLYTMNDEGKYETEYSWKWDETASAILSPGDAFFTQTAVIGDGKTENLRFSKLYYADNASGTVAYRMPALAMSAEGYGTDEVIILPYGDESADETGSGRAANGLDYRFGVDGVKFASLNDTLPQISVCGTDGVGLSLLSHAPVGTEIPLTVAVKGESAYTFSLTDKTVYAAYANVCIKDKASGTVANLLSGDYTTSVSPSDSPSRFSLVIGGSMEADQRRRKTGMYNTGGVRVSKPYDTGVYIEVGDKVRKVLEVR